MAGIFTELRKRDLADAEDRLREEVYDRFIDAHSDADEAEDVVVRDILPAQDLEPGADNDWDGEDREWVQDFSDGTADDYNEAYVIDSDENAESKIIGILVVRQQSGTPITKQIRVRDGSDGSQGVRDILQVQGLISNEDATGVVTEMLIFGYNDSGIIEFYIDDTGTENIVFEGAVAESTGNTLSNASNYELED